MRLLLLLLVSLASSALAVKNYEGYHILETSVVTKESLSGLLVLEKNSRFDMLTRPIVGRSLRIMTSPDNVHELWDKLEKLNLKPQIHANNVAESLERQRKEWETIKKQEKKSARAVTFDRYMELNEIYDYMAELSSNYPNLVTIEDLGTTLESRPIRAVRISNGPGNKRVVFLDAGVHAREWAGPPTALKMIYELVENYDNNKDLVDMFDWLILPVTNPDGYYFTFNGDRFWRKNRNPNDGATPECMGVDPNRNYGFHWGEDHDNDTCTQTYDGKYAFSEAESSAVGQVLEREGKPGNIALYMTTHVYGAFLLYPWGYTYTMPPNADDLQAAGDAAAEAIRAVNGANFVVGSAANVYFAGYGDSVDYAYGVCSVLYGYTWELTAGGVTGFDPPNEEIDIIATETWAGIKELARYVYDH